MVSQWVEDFFYSALTNLFEQRYVPNYQQNLFERTPLVLLLYTLDVFF